MLGEIIMAKSDFHEEFLRRQFKWLGPRYYDYPDGEDLLGKLKFTTFYAGVVGLAIGGTYASGTPELPPTLRGKMLRTAQGVIPCLGAAVLFTTTTYFCTLLRKKDDELNYVIGGLVSGASLAVTTLPQFAFLGILAFPSIGVFQKYFHKKGRKLIPVVQTSYWSPYFRNRFNTMIAERKGNWTKD